MIRFTIIFLTLLTLLSCEKKAEWTLQQQLEHQVVVDGIITDELKKQSIRITLSCDTLNQEPSPVTGAEVIVSGNGKVYHFHEKVASPGFYESDKLFAGVAGLEYSLLVTISDKVYTAKAKLGSGQDTFDAFTYVRNPSSNLFQVARVPDAYTIMTPVMYELLIDWSKVPGYSEADSASTHAKLLYYALPTLDVSEIFAPTMEKIKFPAGTIITERRYFLTNEYAAYIRALLLETTWQGGYFTTAAANVPTNLSSGAIGYFAACVVTTRTVIVHGVQP